MSDLPERERLQPSLLDRLQDDEPNQRVESRDKRVLSMARFRDSVRRDLEHLLNTSNLHSTLNALPPADREKVDLSRYPEVQRSVINYGIPDLTGTTASGIDIREIERTLRQCIVDFEPRLVRNSVRVRAVVDPDTMGRTAVSFEIDATLWAHPLPLQMFLRTNIDLETGEATVEDAGGG